MKGMIEPLESRTLLSASLPSQAAPVATDVSALTAAAKVAVADVKNAAKLAAADAKALKADLHRLKGQPLDAALLKTFQKQEAAAVKTLMADVSTLVHNGSATFKRLVSDVTKLAKNPSNPTFQSNVSSDLVALAALAISSPTTKIISDATGLQQTLNSDLDALAAANPNDAQVQTDVAKAKSDLTTTSTTLQNDANTIVADVKALATALAGA
jgi:hypothetical protein